MFSKLSYQSLSLLVIVALAIAVGSALFAIISYQKQQEAMEDIYEVQRNVREKLLIDSVLSHYEVKHRQRMDSLTESYQLRIDSLSAMLPGLKNKSNGIQTELIAADSLLPVY